EELGVKPGDFVSYYAKATDNNGVDGPKTTTSDIYFLNVKPFRKDYKAAPSQAGGGGGGGGGDVNALSEQQRQIVAATFNVVRDKDKLSKDKFRENVVFLNLAQAKLRTQVDELVQKLEARVGVVDPGFKAIAEALPKASAEMKTAEGNLKAQQPKEALSPEQRALKLLQDAEENYEVQVRQGGSSRRSSVSAARPRSSSRAEAAAGRASVSSPTSSSRPRAGSSSCSASSSGRSCRRRRSRCATRHRRCGRRRRTDPRTAARRR